MAQNNHPGHRPRPARNNRIKALRIAGWIVVGLIAAVALALLLGLLVQYLWNVVVSNVFGVQSITYWQALGLFFLAKLLVGGFGSNVTTGGSRKARGKRDGAGVQFPPGSDDWQRYWEEEGRAAFAAYLQRQEQARQDSEPE